jgi:hypothetical protein
MTDTKGFGELVNRHDSWVATPGFKTADILLTEPGKVAELFLRQPLFEPNPTNILAHQLAHVHAQEKRGLHNLSLRTILCTMARRPAIGLSGSGPQRRYLIHVGNRKLSYEPRCVNRHFFSRIASIDPGCRLRG